MTPATAHPRLDAFRRRVFAALCLGWLVCDRLAAGGEPVAIPADRDNTLYESLTGALSNGAGSHIFAGTNIAGLERRALLRFDVAGALPPDAVIVSAEVVLEMDRSIAEEVFIGLHQVTADWGEGASDASMLMGGGGGAPAEPGDATWLHAFLPGVLWSSEGGDFLSAASAVISVAAPGTYAWTSPQLAADVAAWLADPTANYGWAVVADASIVPGARRFVSRDSPEVLLRPRLMVAVARGETAVPALDTWMLGLFALLLAGLGAGLVKRTV